MGFSLCFGVFILHFIVLNGVHAYEGDVHVMKNEFGLKRMKTVMPRSNPDEFDCVDIYKQPAFRHPLLKNHKIQLEPDYLKDSKEFSPKNSCPPGKVPIAKATTSHPGNENEINFQHFAVVESELGIVLHGARSLIQLHNPPAQKFQFSMANVWVLAGVPSEVDSIQAGWGVHPYLYGDNNTHLTTFWTANNFAKSGCYDARCPGFVQTHRYYHPGQNFPRDIVDESKRNVFDVTLFQDKDTGNWWLLLKKYVKIGYWPKELFTHLVERATHLRYGGWSGSFPSLPSPPMGNGKFPTKYVDESSFFSRIRIFNSSYIIVRSSTIGMHARSDAPSCYNAISLGNQGEYYGDLLTYGGPGGTKCGS